MPVDYPYYLERLTRTAHRDDSGGPVTLWNQSGSSYWCAIEEVSATETDEAGVAVLVVACLIRVRQEPELNTGDRLRDPDTGEVYDIRSVRNGDDELLCDADRKRPEAPEQ